MPRNLGNFKYLNGDWATGITAAGSTQSDATTLPSNHCYVETVASGEGVVVKAMDDGEEFSVANADSAEDLLVYPPSGAQFNGLTADVAVTLPPGGACQGRFVSNTKIILVTS